MALTPQPTATSTATPAAFALPDGCRIAIALAIEGGTEWRIDCGAERDRNARATLGPALEAQGWVSCGVGLASAAWRRDTVIAVVYETSGAAGDLIRMTQRQSTSGECH